MTTRTRRRVLVSLVVLALTLPAESILLKAVTAPDVKDAAKQYVSSLSASQLQAAAATIETYPFAYRRQILAALSPEDRSAVWQNHIAVYLQSHSNLDLQTASLIRTIGALYTAQLLSAPSDEQRTQVVALIEQVQQVIGREDAQFVFARLGPKDTAVTVTEPLSETLTNYVRQAYTLLAFESGGDCDCASQFGCDSGVCDTSLGCTTVSPWPACGWGLFQACDGTCSLPKDGV